MSTPACMGGWCSARNRCSLHLQDDRTDVAERLCKRGEETPIFIQSPTRNESQFFAAMKIGQYLDNGNAIARHYGSMNNDRSAE